MPTTVRKATDAIWRGRYSRGHAERVDISTSGEGGGSWGWGSEAMKEFQAEVLLAAGARVASVKAERGRRAAQALSRRRLSATSRMTSMARRGRRVKSLGGGGRLLSPSCDCL